MIIQTLLIIALIVTFVCTIAACENQNFRLCCVDACLTLLLAAILVLYGKEKEVVKTHQKRTTVKAIYSPGVSVDTIIIQPKTN